METLQNLQKYFQVDSVQVTQKIINRNAIVNEAYNTYLSTINLYLDRFSEIPNQMILEGIDTLFAIPFLRDEYAKEISDELHNKSYFTDDVHIVIDYYFFMFEDLMVYFTEVDSVKFLYKNTPEHKVFEVVRAIKAIKKPTFSESPRMHVVTNGYDGLVLTELEVESPKIDFKTNYNEDFSEVHHIIRNQLLKEDSKGLILLHGKPGTGKTTYIRYLIASLKKKVIFVPTGMAAHITQPSLLSLLLRHKNSVLVIEDSETLISDREIQDSPVAALLNITDGLLSDALKIQVICSFNTELSKIDKALLRKGRLIARYEFLELEVEKANALSKKLKLNKRFEEPCTLAEIYNAKERGFGNIKSQTKIGFTF